MTPTSAMSTIMTIILLSVGLIGILQIVNHICRRSMYSSRNILPVDIVVGILYFVVCAVVGLLYIYAGYDIFMIYGALGVAVLVTVGLFVRFCFVHRRSMQMRNVVLFVVYFAVVLYLTVFMRIGSVDTSIVTVPFDDLTRAITERDPALVTHMALNVLMFVPFGYLVPAMNPKYFRKWSFAMLGGLVASTVIEGTQMIFSLGQSDVDDIIANTLGAVVGYILIRFIWQFRKNWRV